MPPKTKSESNKTLSRKSNVPKAEKIAVKSSSPMKTRSKMKRSSAPTVPKTPKNEKNIEEIPSSSRDDSPVTPIEGSKKVKNEMDLVTPKMMKYYLNAYKESPNYRDLKNKRFNTSFYHERPRGDRGDIKIWEEDSAVTHSENRMGPGDKYANAFFYMVGLSDSDEDIKPVEVKAKAGSKGKGKGSKGKRGRKKSIKSLTLSDEAMMIDYSCLLDKNQANSGATSD